MSDIGGFSAQWVEGGQYFNYQEIEDMGERRRAQAIQCNHTRQRGKISKLNPLYLAG